MTPLQKKREQAWTQWKNNAGLEQDDKRLSANFSSSDMRSAVHVGFDAMYAEHERIVKGLLEAINKAGDKFDQIGVYQHKNQMSGSVASAYALEGIKQIGEALYAYKRECEELF